MIRGRAKDKLRSISDTKIEASILKLKSTTAEGSPTKDGSRKSRRKGSKPKRRPVEEPARPLTAIHISTITEEEEDTDIDPSLDDLPSSSDTMLTSTDDENMGSGSGSHSLNGSPISIALASANRKSPDRIRVVPAPLSSSTGSSSSGAGESRALSPTRVATVSSQRSESPSKAKRTKTPPHLVVGAVSGPTSTGTSEAAASEAVDDAMATLNERRKAGPRRQRSDKDMKGAARFSILNLDDNQLQELQKLNHFEVLQVTDKRASRSSAAGPELGMEAKSDKKVVVVSSKMPNSRSLLRAFESGKSLMRWNSDTGFRNKLNTQKQQAEAQKGQLQLAVAESMAPALAASSSSSSGSTRSGSKKGITKTNSWSQRQFDQSKADIVVSADTKPTKSSGKDAESSAGAAAAPLQDTRKAAQKKMRRSKPSASFGDLPGARSPTVETQNS